MSVRSNEWAKRVLNAVTEAREEINARRTLMQQHDAKLEETQKAIRDAVYVAEQMPGQEPWKPHVEYIKHIDALIAEGKKI